MGTGSSYLKVKWPDHDSSHSHPPSTKVMNAWSYTSYPTCALSVH